MSESSVVKGVPVDYAFERLAQRWSVPPYTIEREMDDPDVQRWVLLGLEFLKLEAVEIRRG